MKVLSRLDHPVLLAHLPYRCGRIYDTNCVARTSSLEEYEEIAREIWQLAREQNPRAYRDNHSCLVFQVGDQTIGFWFHDCQIFMGHVTKTIHTPQNKIEEVAWNVDGEVCAY